MLHFPTGSNWPGVWERRFCEQLSISRLPSGRAGGFAKRGGHGPQETARYFRLRDLQILSKNTIYPLVMTNIAVENGPFIDGLPVYLLQMVIFHGYVNHNQMVHPFTIGPFICLLFQADRSAQHALQVSFAVALNKENKPQAQPSS